MALLERLLTPRCRREQAAGTTFADLVAARAHAGAAGEGRREYERTRAAFERSCGRVEDAYFAPDGSAGVAITASSEGLARLHVVADGATQTHPELGGLVEDWEALATRAQLLRGGNALVCMRRIFGPVKDLVVLALAAQGGKLDLKPHLPALRVENERDLADVSAFYVRTATRSAYIEYFLGMIVGVLSNLALAAGALAFVGYGAPELWGVKVAQADQARALLAVIAGGMGVFLSVLMRMSAGRFTVDYEIERRDLRVIASFRPYIGAVSGLAVLFALKGGVLVVHDGDANAWVLGLLAFVAGFSERFARDTFLRGAGVAQDAGDAADAPAAPATAPARRQLAERADGAGARAAAPAGDGSG